MNKNQSPRLHVVDQIPVNEATQNFTHAQRQRLLEFIGFQFLAIQQRAIDLGFNEYARQTVKFHGQQLGKASEEFLTVVEGGAA